MNFVPSAFAVLRGLTVGAALLLAACASGSTSGAGSGSPDDVTVRVDNQGGEQVLLRYVYEASVPRTLGSVAAGADAEFSLRYSQGFNLRLMADFVERRTGTSNPIDDLQPGDVLELTINQRKELELRRAPSS